MILSYLPFHFSLGCGIGYGYLHRIPTRPVLPNDQNQSVVQSTADGSTEELPASDHAEVSVITPVFHIISH